MGPLRWIFLPVALLLSAPAMADCSMAKYVDLPVTMSGRIPLVEAKFGDKAARFTLDSGAFYSTLSRASAAEFGQRVESLPSWFRVKGIGGDTSAGYIVAKNFSLASVTIPNANFVVGGSDIGTTGLLGQNILGIADVEYDLPHGVVRLWKTTGCAKTSLAYWANTKPFTIVKMEAAPEGPWKPHTIGTILLNGVKIKAVFDSGAQSSLLSLAAAKRAGVTPQSPGVTPAGFSRGLGTHQLPVWLAPFDVIDIGGEAIHHPKIRISDVDFNNGDMLVGIDFFLTHRIFVSNANHAIYITYEGGPVFGLSGKGAVSADGTALDLTNTAPEPTTAEQYSRRGAVFASNHRLPEALADFDKAIALAPTEGRYVYQRAMAHFANQQAQAAAADLDRAITLAPADPLARIARAELRLHDDNRAGAHEDVVAADQALAPSAEQRLRVAALYDQLDTPEAAITNYDQWLQSHREDNMRATALNGRCWARGLLNRELDAALSDCNAAVKLQPKNASFLDSRALVRLRRGDLAQALGDYNAAAAITPRNAWTLYMRSVVEQKTGDTAHADADRTLALSINPRVTNRARKIGF